MGFQVALRILLLNVRTNGVRHLYLALFIKYSLTSCLTSRWQVPELTKYPLSNKAEMSALFHLSHKHKNPRKGTYNTLLIEDTFNLVPHTIKQSI